MSRSFTTTRRTSARSERQAILEKMDRWIGEGTAHCSDIHDRCEDNLIYLGGEQWGPGDMERQAAKDRPAMPMNKVLSSLNAIANREVMERFSPRVYPRSREDSGWAEVQDAFLRWQRDQSEAEHEETMAFRTAVATGYSCLHTYWDPLEDEGRGLIVHEEIPIWWMLWDRRARKQNLTDRRWHLCGKYVSRDEAEQEFGSSGPEARKHFERLRLADTDTNPIPSSGGGGQRGWGAARAGSWYASAEDEIFLVEAEWRDIQVQYRAAVPRLWAEVESLLTDPDFEMPLPDGSALSGEAVAALDSQARDELLEGLLAETQIQVFETFQDLEDFRERYFDLLEREFVDWAKEHRYVYRYAVRTDDVLLDFGERPVGFTYEFLTGLPLQKRDGQDFIGWVDVTRGPQDWRNTFMSLVLTRLAQSPKQTVLIEEGALEDPDEFFDQLANPRGAAIVPDGFVRSNRYVMLNPPTFPPIERELIAIADQAILEQAGLSGLDVGQQTDLRRISNRVVQSAKVASNTILALYFDSLRRSRKRTARLVLRYMTEFFSPGEVLRIVGEEKTQDLTDPSQWPERNRFDIKIDEAATTPTDQIEFWESMTQTGLAERLLSGGYVPFDVMLDWIPNISEHDRRRIREHQQQQDTLNQLVAHLSATPEGQAQLAQFQQQTPQQAPPQPPA